MTLDTLAYYTEMNECKKYLDSLPNRKKLCEKTKREYIRDLACMHNNDADPLTACTTKNTFYKYRAAWNYTFTQLANDIYQQATVEIDIAKKIECITALSTCITKLKKFPPDPDGLNFIHQAQGLYSSDWQLVKDQAPPSKSKKYQISTLPKNWRERFFKHILEKNSKYTTAIATLAITGCRPAELENGITLHLLTNQTIKVRIQGKKTHDGIYGQDFREFEISYEGPEFSYLLEKIPLNNQPFLVQVASANALGEQMRKYSNQVFSKIKGNISPYTYRHAFAKNIKSILSSKTDIALALGHSNDKSQRYYANKGKNGGGFQIEKIEGTRAVKQISSNNSFNVNQLSNDSGGRMSM